MLASGGAEAAPRWTLGGVVVSGRQFAAVRGDSVVHVIGQRYVQVDATGTVVVDEADVADGRQGPLDFYPAIAVGDDGAVHVVTRSGGDFDIGHDIRYRRRAPGGGWDPEIAVGTPVPRNYVVGVAAASGGRVLVAHGRMTNDVNAVIDLYEITGGAANPIGSTPQGWLRTDNDFWLASHDNVVALASGTPGPADPFHVAFATDANGDVVAQWEASHSTHDGGAPRRGGPSLYADGGGRFHVGYGGESTHHYAGFTSAGAPIGPGVQTMGNLGTWHLSYGNGAVVASDDGMSVLAVGLQNLDGDQTAGDAEIWWAESTDAGASFTAAQSLGVTTDGGEGRMRPRLAVVDGTLVLLYFDPGANGVVVATAPWVPDDPGGTGDDTTGAADAGGTEGDGATDNADGSATTGPVGPTSGSPGSTGDDALPPGGGGRGGDDGCGCNAPVGGGIFPLCLMLLPIGRRRRRAHETTEGPRP
jgi:hypothetical protein